MSNLPPSGKVNWHNSRIWGLQNPQEALELDRDSPKVNMFCALSQTKVYWPFFFAENTVTGVTYLAMLQNWLLPQMSKDSEDFIFQQDGAPPPLAPACSTFSEWISTSKMDRSRRERRLGASILAPENSWSHTLLLFLWGFKKETVYVPSLPTTLEDLKKQYHNCGELTNARHSSSYVERINYRLHVTRVAGGGGGIFNIY